jgi:hypothetical protein
MAPTAILVTIIVIIVIIVAVSAIMGQVHRSFRWCYEEYALTRTRGVALVGAGMCMIHVVVLELGGS